VTLHLAVGDHVRKLGLRPPSRLAEWLEDGTETARQGDSAGRCDALKLASTVTVLVAARCLHPAVAGDAISALTVGQWSFSSAHAHAAALRSIEAFVFNRYRYTKALLSEVSAFLEPAGLANRQRETPVIPKVAASCTVWKSPLLG
jgi:hypothetical protein